MLVNIMSIASDFSLAILINNKRLQWMGNATVAVMKMI